MKNGRNVVLGLLAVGMVMAAAEMQAADKGGKKKLELSLPKALFIGTPKTIKSANLVPKKDNDKYVTPSVMVPAGTENVAEDMEVTGSDTVPVIGELDYLTDGDKEGSDGSYVELGPGKQHVQIDLEEAKTISAVAVWHYHSQARVYYDVIVQVSDDPDFISPKTIFNNDHDNSSGLGAGKDKEYIETFRGILIDAKGVKGQYVRLYSNGSTSSEMNHYIEVEIHGKSAK